MTDFRDYLRRARSGKPTPESRHVVQRDKWDRGSVEKIEKEMKEFNLAAKDLQEAAHTGSECMSDTFLELFKVNPELKPGNEIRPSYQINQKVMQEFTDDQEYDSLHNSSMGDPIAAGLASALLEPQLESIFEKLEKEQEKAQQIEQQLLQFEDMSMDAQQIAENLANDVYSEQEAKDYQKELDSLNEQLDALEDSLNQDSQDLAEALNQQTNQIGAGVSKAISQAKETMDTLDEADGWSFSQGSVAKMDPAARLELAKKLQTDKFKMMADVFGRMQDVAMSSQLERVNYVPEEIYDLQQGNHLEHLIPTEIAYASDDVLVYDFMRRYVENSLIEYALRGTETVNKGGIIILEDASGSMSGTREIYAKAIALALLKIAQMQSRPFHSIMFSGPGSLVEFEWDTSKVPVEMTLGNQTSYGIDAVVKYAEAKMSGGTDFMTPLSKALSILDKQFSETGATDADIVFLTDGQCNVNPDWLRSFKQDQERIGFKVYGIAIQTSPENQPFNTICDGRAIGIKDLTDTAQMAPLFEDM